MSEENQDEKSLAIGALWGKVSRNNTPFMSGIVDLPDGTKLKIVCFKGKIFSEKSPQWRIFKQKNYTETPKGDFGETEDPF